MSSFWNEFAPLRVQPTDGNANCEYLLGSIIPGGAERMLIRKP